MPARRIPQNWGQPTAQQDDAYSNYNAIPWGSGLQLGNTHEEGMFTTNVSYTMTRVNTTANVNQESNASAIHPSFIPTPLQTTMGTGFLPPGEPPSEGSGANWMSSWESHEVDGGLSMRVQQLQLESPTPSTSNHAAGLGVPNKPKKKEESGVCAQGGRYTHAQCAISFVVAKMRCRGTLGTSTNTT